METSTKRDLIILGSGTRVIHVNKTSKNDNLGKGSVLDPSKTATMSDKDGKKFTPPKSIFKKKSTSTQGETSSENGVDDVKKAKRNESPGSLSNTSIKIYPSGMNVASMHTYESRVNKSDLDAFSSSNIRQTHNETPRGVGNSSNLIYDDEDDDWGDLPSFPVTIPPKKIDESADLSRIVKMLPPKGNVNRPDWGGGPSAIKKSKYADKVTLLPAGFSMSSQQKPKGGKFPDSGDSKMRPKSRTPFTTRNEDHFTGHRSENSRNTNGNFDVRNTEEPVVEITTRQNTNEVEWDDSDAKRCSENFFGEEPIPCDKEEKARMREERDNEHIDELLILLKTEMIITGHKLEDVELPEALKERFLKIEIPDEESDVKSGEESLKEASEGCECGNCDGWAGCSKWRAGNLYNGGEKAEGHVPFLSDETMNDLIKKVIGDVLVHGQLIPDAESKFDDLIDADVMVALEDANYAEPNSMQQIVWPAVFRGMNVCIIDKPTLGKSLSYLPALCTFLRANDSLPPKESSRRTTALILCNSFQDAYALSQKISVLFSNVWDGYCPVVKLLKNTSQPEDKDYDLVIATPDILEEQLKTGTLNLKQLSYLVLEQCEEILRMFPETMRKLLHYLNDLCSTRPRKQSLQIIVTCEQWSADVNNLIKKIHIAPIVCFGNYIEAALYSGVQFQKKMVQNNYKQFYLEDLLKRRYSTLKTIVFCETEDVKSLSELLIVKGVENFKVYDKMPSEDYEHTVSTFNSTSRGYHKVLLCTDQTLKKDSVADAEFLVHFSVPEYWSDFVERHRFMINNFNSPLVKSEGVIDYCSFLIIDENVDEKGEIMVNFFKALTRMSACKFQF